MFYLDPSLVSNIRSYQGGTDIVSLFAGHNTYLPVYKGEIQCRCLGMKVEAWDGSGNYKNTNVR